MKSVWSESTKLPRFERLETDVKTDALVIGGGMAGLLCAHMLRRSGVSCILVEAEKICSGITKNTTAKITSQHGLVFTGMLKRFGAERTKLYLDANEEAIAEYKRLCWDIDCGFEEKDSFVYSRDDIDILEKEIEALAKSGFKAELAQKLPLPFKTAGAVKFSGQAQFNPLKFAAAISQGLKIYEDTRVTELAGNTAITERGRIQAGCVVVATHFPFINKHGSYFLKMYQDRSYVLALKDDSETYGRPSDRLNVDGMYMDENKKGLSFRNYEDLLLIGGGSHRTGKQGSAWDELERFARHAYPNAKTVARWAAQDCMTLDDVPYIGRYSRRTENFYVASGFNKWGMSSSMVAARILADMISGKENLYAKAFSPSRSMLRPQLAINAAEATVNLLTPTKPRCPHMGCALKLNMKEHTWDCPCHGSRFTEDGKLIDNPSTHDM